MAIDLNQDPYFDDFDADKNYHKILFRPSFAVQARELTQSQTILQNQVASFARNIFKNGSIVTGGQSTLEVTSTKYVCIKDTDPSGAAVNVDNFVGKFIIDGDNAGVRAYVIAGAQSTLTAPSVLIVKYTSGQSFNVATANAISTEDGTFSVDLLASLVSPVNFTDVKSGSILGNASICSVDDGVFFMDGFFVAVSSQTLILDAFDNTPSYRIGLQTNDEIISATEDASLLDPAQDATNFQAPGADRYKFALSLVKRTLTSTDDTKFIELLRVVNGVLTKKVTTPIYSVLDDTLARRMNDQSGSFTVRPFKVAFDADPDFANAYTITVETGKAYVQGYEFETISPTYIKAERARATQNVSRYNTTIDFENWIEVTKLVGPIPFKTLQAGVLHCVSTANIATQNSAVAQNTAIGTIRIRAFDYRDGANSTSIQTAVFRAYVFDSNVSQSVVANCSGTGSANTIFLAPNFSSVGNAYVGVKFTITTSGGTAINEHHTIGSYDGPNNKATLNGTETFTFGTPNTETQFQLNYEFKDTEAIVYANTQANKQVFSTSMDIDSGSKDAVLADPFQGTFISDTDFNAAILLLPYPMTAAQDVVGGIPLSNSEYFGRKVYTAVPFTQNVATIVTAAGITSIVNSPLSGSDIVENVLVIVRNGTGAQLANNQVINFSSGNSKGNTVTITSVSNTSTFTITVPDMNSASAADVYVKVNLPFADKIGSVLRTKTARIANVASGLNSGGTQMPDSNNGLVQWYSQGGGTLGAQITIYSNSAAWLNLKDPTKSQSVFTADVTTLRKVIDVGSNAIEDGNVAIAADITSHYTLDTGQRDNSYEHGSISLKPGFSGPTGNVVIYVDYLAHSGLGYLTVDSYASANISYANIPHYLSAVSGIDYSLRDAIDFRPRRLDGEATGSYGEELFGISGTTSFQTDFSYYLARRDKLVLTRDLTFEVLQGIPSLQPVAPSDKKNAMTLYELSLPAYTVKVSDIRQRYYDNRRYTMRDIGTLEKRITQLEYYASLSAQEQAAKSQEITDDAGFNRFKNGILVDAFTGHSIGAVLLDDYHCSMDAENNEMRPPFNLEALDLDIRETDSSNYQRTGSILSLPYTSITLIDQPWAALAVNVNPFNTISWIGNIQLNPSSDNWIETNRAPDLHVNLSGDNDAWDALAQGINSSPNSIFGTKWNSWQTTHAGLPVTRAVGGAWKVDYKWIQNFTTSVTSQQTRTGIKTAFVPETITTAIGDKIIDQSVIAKMRSRGVLFVGKMFSPNTNLFAFFDGTAVTNYCSRPNIVKVFDNAVVYQDTYQQGETVRVFDPARGVNTATALVLLSRNEPTYSNISVVQVGGGDDANIANSYFVHSTNSTFLIGETSGANSRISGYYHNSGFVTNPNVSSILLSHDIANSNVGISNTTIVGQSIHFTSANGAGQSATITAYNFITRNVAFSPSFSDTPNTSTLYSIGDFSSDYRGEVSGLFIIPSTNAVNFRSGTRLFSLVDSSSGDIGNSTTNGQVDYFAQGLLQTVQNTLVSTRVPGIQRTSVTQNQTVTSSHSFGLIVGSYGDPLAETFLIDQRTHPSGVMLTGLRLLIKTKDANIPLQVQLRPVINGFPHASLVVPGTDTIINASNINTVDEITLGLKYAAGENPLDDGTMYTQVNFSGPIFLQPGAEYCMVLIANSVKYQVYIAEMGAKIIGTNRLISSQPYLGSFFKSQNSTTWTPIQEQDLVFRLLYAQFDISAQANIEFQLGASNGIAANVPLDAFYVTEGNLTLPNTTISSTFTTTTALGTRENAQSFELGQNIFFEDLLGRRVATSDVSSFKLHVFMSSLNADISPIVDMDRLSLYAIENLVNTLGLSNNLVVVASSSSNWVTAQNLSVTISGGGGSGANAYVANTQIDSNNHVLANVVVDAAGSGYTSAPTITLSGNTQLTANIISAGEDHPSGGPSISRYITRMVTLADGMDAGDFRVFLSAYFPNTADIFVYYKILSADDPTPFDSRGYQLMTIIQGQNNVSKNQQDIKDYVFAPGTVNVADDRVQYGSFTSFKYFAIKVVLSSSDTTKVPRVSNFRVVALPALT